MITLKDKEAYELMAASIYSLYAATPSELISMANNFKQDKQPEAVVDALQAAVSIVDLMVSGIPYLGVGVSAAALSLQINTAVQEYDVSGTVKNQTLANIASEAASLMAAFIPTISRLPPPVAAGWIVACVTLSAAATYLSFALDENSTATFDKLSDMWSSAVGLVSTATGNLRDWEDDFHSEHDLANGTPIAPVYHDLHQQIMLTLRGDLSTDRSARNSANRVVEAMSNLPEQGIEDWLRAVERMFGVDGSTVSSVDDYAERSFSLMAAVSEARQSGVEFQVVEIINLSSGDLVDIVSRGGPRGIATLYALLEMNPFAVVGDLPVYQSQVERLDVGQYSTEYLLDRATMLVAMIDRNLEDDAVADGATVVFNDLISDQTIHSGGALPQFPNGHIPHVVFADEAGGLIEGHSAADRMYGSQNADTIIGREGDDRLEGRGGSDILTGGNGADILYGGDDADHLLGGSGSDVIHGGDGADYLYGGSRENPFGDRPYQDQDDNAPDMLYGGLGHDTYYVFNGDTVIDEDGDGTIVFNNGQTIDLGANINPHLTSMGIYEAGGGFGQRSIRYLVRDLDGDGQLDDLEVVGSYLRILNFDSGDFGIALSDENNYIAPTPGDTTNYVTVDPEANGPYFFDGLSSYTVYGSELADFINADPLATGEDHGDVFYGEGGGDLLVGRGGDDFLYGGEGSDLLLGDWGNDYIEGGADADFISGGEGRDTLHGGAEGDAIAGGLGEDLIFGGDGDDVIAGDASLDAPDWWGEYVAFELGADGSNPWPQNVEYFGFSLYHSLSWDSVDGISIVSSFDLQGLNGEADTIDGGAGNDLIWAGGGDDTVSGGEGHDNIQGGTGNDLLLGGDGRDLLEGQAGDDYLDGGAERDFLTGGEGRDVLHGGEGDDQLEGGADRDQLYGGIGDDLLLGGDGHDALYGDAGADSLSGGDDNDTLAGGEGEDELFGQAGDDSLDGGADDDSLWGGEGRDVLLGGEGDDQLMGGKDDDTLAGGEGADVLFGEEGSDSLSGGEGDDHLDAGAGDDYLDGGEGDDELQGGIGNDSLSGGAGDDRLFGMEGDDNISGGDGDDILVGGPGADSLAGGRGDDLYFVDSAADSVSISDLDGTDEVRFEGSNFNDWLLGLGSLQLTNTRTGTVVHIEGFDPNRPVDGLAIERFTFDDGTYTAADLLARGFDLFGTDGVDTVSGTALVDRIRAGAGNDVISGGTGADTYYFEQGDGSDQIIEIGGDRNLIEFGSGIDPASLSLSQDGDDLLVGYGQQGDQIRLSLEAASGGVAADLISELRFADGTVIQMADYFNVSPQVGEAIEAQVTEVGGVYTLQLPAGAFADANAGDTLTLQTLFMPEWLSFDAASGTFSGTPTEADLGDQGFLLIATDAAGLTATQRIALTVVESGPLHLVGTADDDVLHGHSADDTLFGAEGHDVLYGGAGNDILYGREGDDQLYGEAGDDHLEGFSGRDYLDGGAGQDFLSGGDDSDTLIGGEGDDTLHGGYSDDVLDGGQGADTMVGGIGSDTYLVDNAGDVVYEEVSDVGDDLVRSSVDFTLEAGVEHLELLGSADLAGTGNLGNNRLIGNAGNNLLQGLDGADVLDGGAGVDQLVGGEGGDTYIVDRPEDQIVEDGSSGVDTVVAGFDYTLGATLEDLVLSGELHINGTGNLGDNRLVGNAGDNQLYGLEGDDEIRGGGGDDLLDGGVGADEMDGGLGSDTYVVNQVGDRVIESELDLGSTDTVQSAIDWRLSVQTEVLQLQGSEDLVGWGSAGAQQLYGNDGDNSLFAHAMDGELDTVTALTSGPFGVYFDLELDGARERLFERAFQQIFAGTLTLDELRDGSSIIALDAGLGSQLFGGEGNDTLYGDLDDDLLDGGAGNDVLVGSGGSDTMRGGAGDDIYVVSGPMSLRVNAGLFRTPLLAQLTYTDDGVDTIVEVDGEGVDLVYSSVDFVLPDFVENLTLLNGASPYDPDLALFGESLVADVPLAVYGGGNAQDNWIVGNDLDNRLDGFAGNDVLVGGFGDDHLDGGAGADTMEGGYGSDTYVVDDAADVIVDDGGLRDVVESSVDYTLGDGLEDLYLTGEADLTGAGNSGDNRIVGNSGDNTLFGDTGDDVLDGGLGADTMDGGEGDDTYYVDNAGDEISDEDGYDTVHSASDYTLQSGLEVLRLQEGAAILGTGNDADNALYGNSQDNVLEGLDGSDYLDGGQGADTLRGGAGDDVYVVDHVADVVEELPGAADEGGYDQILSWVDYSLEGLGVEDIRLLGNFDGSDPLANSYQEPVSMPAQVPQLAAINATGNELDNSILGSDGANELRGLDGDDVIDGAAGNDVLYGGAGDDWLFGGADALYREQFVHEPGYEEGDPVLVLSEALADNDDVLYGGDGHDFLDGHTGDDVLHGGDGDDVIYGGLEDAYGIEYAHQVFDRHYETYNGVSRVTWTEGRDPYRLSDNDSLFGGAGDDFLDGGIGNDILDGGVGIDEMQGGEGDDVYYVDGEVEYDVETIQVDAFCGETLTWNIERAYVYADEVFEREDEGYDIVYSTVWMATPENVEEFHFIGEIPTTYTGGWDDDEITGSDGDDTLDGGEGADVLIGGMGDDLYVFDDGDDVAIEFEGEGNDTILSYTWIDLYDFEHIENAVLIGYEGSEVYGNQLDNLLVGSAYDDELYGDEGDDRIDGGAGDDYLAGESGNDVMSGGAGADTYELVVGDGQDTILDTAYIEEGETDPAEYGNTISLSGSYSEVEQTYVPLTVDDVLVERVDAGIRIRYGSQGDEVLITNCHPGDEIASVITHVWIEDELYAIQDLLQDSNIAPEVAEPLVDQQALEDEAFSFAIPPGTFVDANAGDVLNLEATLADGSALPSWLVFDAATGTFSGTPENADVGVLELTVTATDQSGEQVSDTFQLEVINVNDAPVLVAPQSDIEVAQGEAVQFTIPDGAFEDVDLGDELSYSATLSNGDPLPAWLSFDSATGTLSGTPDNADVGLIEVSITATDLAGATAVDTFEVTVNNVNDAPVVAAPLLDQQTLEDEAYSFSVPAGTFEDLDVGDGLALAATLADGSALPSWLEFDAATGTFSGTPENADVGVLELTVTATDQSGEQVSDTFRLEVINVNDAPVLVAPQPDIEVAQGEAVQFTIPDGAFEDVDLGDELSYSATLSNGDPLPAWLSFDSATGTLSGTPDNADVGLIIEVSITATDLAGATAVDTFEVTVNNVNDAPVVAAPLLDQQTLEDEAYSFSVPAGTFEDLDVGDGLTLAATLADGSALPSWLVFDAATRTFSGTPENADVGVLELTVTATDQSGEQVSDTFRLEVINVNDAPVLVVPHADHEVRAGEQLRIELSTGAFHDADIGDVLTYSATLANGEPLPDWLSVDAQTGALEGTPGDGDAGVLTVSLIATDLAGLTATDTFQLTVVGDSNDVPVVAEPLPDQQTLEDEHFSFSIPEGTFADADAGDLLSLEASVPGGGALPDWLAFDATTGTFSGTPENADVGVLEVVVTARDQDGESVSDTFVLDVLNVNDAPVLVEPQDDQVAQSGQEFFFEFPVEAFDDIDVGDVLTLSATLANGEPLPSWLVFDAATGAFAGTPMQSDAGNIVVRVTATDLAGASVSESFALAIHLLGTDGDDELVGSDGDDVINGLGGNDRMSGGLGDDTYYVDAACDEDHGPDDHGHGGGHGNEGVGNGDDPPPPGHDDNQNDGPGTGPGNPGSKPDEDHPGRGGGRGRGHNDEGGHGDQHDEVDDPSHPEQSCPGDVVAEHADEGYDLVYSSVDYELPENVEELHLVGLDDLTAAGNELDNVLVGNAGSNVLDGREGHDIMSGGEGNDTYFVDSLEDEVREEVDGGFDTIVTRVDLAGVENVERVVLDERADSSTLTGGSSNDAFSGNALDNVLLGNAGNDYLFGADGADRLEGGSGDDILSGGDGQDVLLGGAGANLLFGGRGDDLLLSGSDANLLIGGEGDDRLEGGSGADIFVFNKGDGEDVVVAHGEAIDTLSIGGDLRLQDLKFRRRGKDLVLSLGGKDSITLEGWYDGNQSVQTLQIVMSSTRDFEAGEGEAWQDNHVELFDFAALVAEFDDRRRGSSSWALTNALSEFHLSGSDTEALGGDISYHYGMQGSLAGIGVQATQDVLADANFGRQPQGLRPLSGIQFGDLRID